MFRLCHSVALWIGFSTLSLHNAAQGIPEPPVILYGTVLDNRTAANIVQTNGILRVRLESSENGEILTFTTQLTDIMGKYSFVLALPTETPVPGFSQTPNYLRIRPSAVIYKIKDISLNDVVIHEEAFTPTQWTNSAAMRGAIRRVNAVFVPPSVIDTEPDGLPDDWEVRFFGGTSAKPGDDPDRDGKTNLQEFLEGTDPKDRTFLDISVLSASPRRIQLKWETKPGKTYQLKAGGVLPFDSSSLIQEELGDGSPILLEIDVQNPATQRFFEIIE